jgi:chromosome condensin MukBEF ATPase and DNA-binding subunit MukB
MKRSILPSIKKREIKIERGRENRKTTTTYLAGLKDIRYSLDMSRRVAKCLAIVLEHNRVLAVRQMNSRRFDVQRILHQFEEIEIDVRNRRDSRFERVCLSG